jgi:hypothetical protein
MGDASAGRGRSTATNRRDSLSPDSATDECKICPGNSKGGSIIVTFDLLFDWFGLVCFGNKNKKMSVVIELIPNQSNRGSTVQ